jgi:regulator of nucleoside diphosphate kinase
MSRAKSSRLMSRSNTLTGRQAIISNAERNHSEHLPPIVLTALDREKLLAFLNDPLATMEMIRWRQWTWGLLAFFVRRSNVQTSRQMMLHRLRWSGGYEVKFIDHEEERIRCVKFVFPEEAQNSHCISILSSIGSALIGLGPGQSIQWTER